MVRLIGGIENYLRGNHSAAIAPVLRAPLMLRTIEIAQAPTHAPDRPVKLDLSHPLKHAKSSRRKPMVEQ